MALSVTATPEWIMQNPEIIQGIFIMMPSVIFMVMMLIWMYKAFRVSCNLRGWKLGFTYAIVIIVGDIICRLLINLMY